jgi:hypothetical protein
MEQPKVDKKKLAPSSVDDQDNKKYENEELMAMIFDEDDDNEILAGYEEKIDEEKVEKKKSKSKKQEVDLDKEFDDEFDEDELKEDDEEDDEEDLEEPEDEEETDEEETEEDEEDGEDEEDSELGKLKLSKKTKKTLSPFKGNLEQRVEQLARSYRELQQKLSKYSFAEKAVKELGFDELDQNQAIAALKELKSAYNDYLKNPAVLDIIENLAQGKIPDNIKIFSEEKTPQDFMAEGEYFDVEESMSVPGSPSWKAREQWEQWKSNTLREKQEFIEKIRQQKQIGGTDIQTVKQKLEAKFKELKKFAEKEFGIDEEDFNEFVSDFQSLPLQTLKASFAVWARSKGLEPKRLAKIKRNRNKNFVEGNIGAGNDFDSDSSLKTYGVSKEQEEEYKNSFRDWDTDDGVVY